VIFVIFLAKSHAPALAVVAIVARDKKP